MSRKIKTVEIVCEQCAQKVNRPKERRFCNRSCANKWLHSQGILSAKGIIGMNMSIESLVARFGETEGRKKYEEFVAKMSQVTSGEKNPMYGRTDHYRNMLEKNKERKGKTEVEYFGYEKAKEIAKKKSIACLGDKNPMYGKPSPSLSGKGVKGHYKNRFFRSLLELTCMKHLENLGVDLDEVDYENFVIPFISYDGVQKTYRPDFFVKSKRLLIEVKPSRLVSTPLNSLKFEAAREFCKERNFEFMIFTEESSTLLKEDLVKDPEVTLLEKQTNEK